MRALHVVAMGGGTGLSTLLRGLRRHVVAPERIPAPAPIGDLAAVVTVTDDGGSSGRLRRASTCCRRATCATAWWR